MTTPPRKFTKYRVAQKLGGVGVFVSLQMSIVKVLSSYPDGRAPLDALNADLKILAGSGRDWTARMKRLAARAPELDIFCQALVVRDAQGWQLTAAGFELLHRVETAPDVTAEPVAAEVPDVKIAADRPRAPLVLIGRKIRRRRKARTVGLKQAG
jgi:hypothetical protein